MDLGRKLADFFGDVRSYTTEIRESTLKSVFDADSIRKISFARDVQIPGQVVWEVTIERTPDTRVPCMFRGRSTNAASALINAVRIFRETRVFEETAAQGARR